MTTAMRRRALGAAPLLLGALMAALPADDRPNQAPREQPRKVEAATPEPIEIPGIENPFRLSPRLYSGGDPHGPEALKALKGLGIRTIVSVDGTTPDAETARRLGMRYVHLPFGYDGVPREQAVRIVKAVQTLPGPVYIHCHHGKHRGPAAAAVCGLATEGWTRDQATRWMQQAGTSPDYRGLYASARAFVVPSAEELRRAGAEFPEKTAVPALVDLMVQVDARWDRLKDVRQAGFQAPPGQPDVDPPHEALMLVEQFRELARLPEAQERGRSFLAAAGAAEARATALEAALRAFGKGPTAEARQAVEAAFLAAGKSCTSCHAGHRDNGR